MSHFLLGKPVSQKLAERPPPSSRPSARSTPTREPSSNNSPRGETGNCETGNNMHVGDLWSQGKEDARMLLSYSLLCFCCYSELTLGAKRLFTWGSPCSTKQVSDACCNCQVCRSLWGLRGTASSALHPPQEISPPSSEPISNAPMFARLGLWSTHDHSAWGVTCSVRSWAGVAFVMALLLGRLEGKPRGKPPILQILQVPLF